MKDVSIIYNPQHDCLFSVLTPRESMLYACELQKFTGQGQVDLLQQEFVFSPTEDDDAEVAGASTTAKAAATSKSGHRRGEAVVTKFSSVSGGKEEMNALETRVNDLIDLLGKSFLLPF